MKAKLKTPESRQKKAGTITLLRKFVQRRPGKASKGFTIKEAMEYLGCDHSNKKLAANFAAGAAFLGSKGSLKRIDTTQRGPYTWIVPSDTPTTEAVIPTKPLVSRRPTAKIVRFPSPRGDLKAFSNEELLAELGRRLNTEE